VRRGEAASNLDLLPVQREAVEAAWQLCRLQ
jgi:hypothetical protein